MIQYLGMEDYQNSFCLENLIVGWISITTLAKYSYYRSHQRHNARAKFWKEYELMPIYNSLGSQNLQLIKIRRKISRTFF